MSAPLPEALRVRFQRSLSNDPRLHLTRPASLFVGPYVHPVIPEKLQRSRHRETPAPIFIRHGIAGQTTGQKVWASDGLRTADRPKTQKAPAFAEGLFKR